MSERVWTIFVCRNCLYSTLSEPTVGCVLCLSPPNHEAVKVVPAEERSSDAQNTAESALEGLSGSNG